jgi:hypothetical protein
MYACRHRRHTHTYIYGTAKETGQMLNKVMKYTAPNRFKKYY